MQVSEQQLLAYQLLDDPQVVELLFGGGAGGGKSMLVTTWGVLECRKFPGIRIGLGRNEISNLRKTTVQTLLRETHPILSVLEDDYRYSSIVDPRIDYRNSSQFMLTDLAYAPSDPDYDRLGSLNLTHVIIEEVGEVIKKAVAVFSSRKNRYLNHKFGIVGKTVMTCNPSTNWLRQEFYDPYVKLGGGRYQKWPIYNDAGEPIMVELPNGKRVQAMRAFVRSLVTDNPFISPNYIEELKSKPMAERKRLLEGNWDYYQDASTLFRRNMFVQAVQPVAKEGETLTNYGGCDPSRGGDECTFVHLVGLHDFLHVKDIVKCKIPDAIKDKGGYVAEEYIKFCKARGIGSINAGVDIVGIGESVGDSGHRLGFPFQRFNAGSTQGVRRLDDGGIDPRINDEKSTGLLLFNNIRSQNFYDMAEGANTGHLTFDDKLPYYDELCSQLEAHGYEPKEKQIIVDKKDEIKKKIGHSPDVADGLQTAWWVARRKRASMKTLVSI